MKKTAPKKKGISKVFAGFVAFALMVSVFLPLSPANASSVGTQTHQQGPMIFTPPFDYGYGTDSVEGENTDLIGAQGDADSYTGKMWVGAQILEGGHGEGIGFAEVGESFSSAVDWPEATITFSGSLTGYMIRADDQASDAELTVGCTIYKDGSFYSEDSYPTLEPPAGERREYDQPIELTTTVPIERYSSYEVYFWVKARARGYGYSQVTFNYEKEGYHVTLDKITVTPSKLPDLAPQNLRTDPETFGPGDYVDIWVDVCNIGDASAVPDWGSIVVQSYLYQNGELIKYGPSGYINEIVEGETKSVPLRSLVWPTDYEEYTIKVWVDKGVAYGNVYESNENNNNITTKKSAPSYTITNPSPADGATIYVSNEEESQDSTQAEATPEQEESSVPVTSLQTSQNAETSLSQDSTQVESTNIETSTSSATESLDSSTANDGTVASGGTAVSTQQLLNLSENSSSGGLLLSWSGAPDGYDMTYKIYFGVDSPSELIGSVETTCCLYSGSLTAGNTYYWKVVAEDEYGTTVEGPVWHFTVSDENNDSDSTSSDGTVASGGTSNAEPQQTTLP